MIFRIRKGTLLYNHSDQDGSLHRGETSIKPRTRCRYFSCCQELEKSVKWFKVIWDRESGGKGAHMKTYSK
jgi:hypothetical protein